MAPRDRMKLAILVALAGCAAIRPSSPLGYQVHALQGQDAAQVGADETECVALAEVAGEHAYKDRKVSGREAAILVVAILVVPGFAPSPHEEARVAALTMTYVACMRARGYELGDSVYRHPLGGAPMYCRTDACQADAELAGYARVPP